MSKIFEFLMNNDINTEVMEEVMLRGFPHPFVIRSISEGQNKALKKAATFLSFDKKTRQKQTEFNADRYNALLLEACVVEPNLKDAELQAKFGVTGSSDLVDKILSPGQYTDLMIAITEINGFDEDINELIDEAKNSSAVETE